MYDYDILKKAWLKFIRDFDMDLYDSPPASPACSTCPVHSGLAEKAG
jgi:hypothetical protein